MIGNSSRSSLRIGENQGESNQDWDIISKYRGLPRVRLFIWNLRMVEKFDRARSLTQGGFVFKPLCMLTLHPIGKFRLWGGSRLTQMARDSREGYDTILGYNLEKIESSILLSIFEMMIQSWELCFTFVQRGRNAYCGCYGASRLLSRWLKPLLVVRDLLLADEEHSAPMAAARTSIDFVRLRLGILTRVDILQNDTGWKSTALGFCP
ncbi:hypothetical protein V6N11_045734 [Hibiscus sabdariffa]|uniref:Uncharacterized protein n=1 Tax=Hibiscus sabdariffa TaxID=183260 RepID=A0ABR2Q1W2_9ROSI